MRRLLKKATLSAACQSYDLSLGDARLLEFFKSLSVLQKLMLVLYQVWLALGGGLLSLANFEPQCPVQYVYGLRIPFKFHSQQWLDRLNAAPGSKTLEFQAGIG